MADFIVTERSDYLWRKALLNSSYSHPPTQHHQHKLIQAKHLLFLPEIRKGTTKRQEFNKLRRRLKILYGNELEPETFQREI